MRDLRDESKLRPRRAVLSAPRPRALDPRGDAGGESARRGDAPPRLGDGWVEQGAGDAEPEVVTQLAYVAPERDAVDMQLDSLLILWHEVTDKYRHERSFSAPSMTNFYLSPTHQDWRHEEVGREMEERVTARRIGDCIRRIEHPWQAAIVIQARNLATGADVWFSPRLPTHREAREVILLEARNKLLVELRKDGVMT